MRRYDKEDMRFLHSTEETTKHWDLLMATAIGFQMKTYDFDGLKDSLHIFVPKD
jgi:hypothetical protein